MNTSHDTRESYCRMLGHFVPFKYCRAANDGLPCRRIRDCWWQHLPIDDFLTANFTVEEIASLGGTPRPKISTIFDCIRRARNNNQA